MYGLEAVDITKVSFSAACEAVRFVKSNAPIQPEMAPLRSQGRCPVGAL